MLELWTARLADVEEAGFGWCWVTPVSPRWQDERQVQSSTTLSQGSLALLFYMGIWKEQIGHR